ncbi:MAG: IclR family transcriptional regulator [Acidobacteriaceae bacterium]|jgi:IclR family KDG regulon transcriptional repressor
MASSQKPCSGSVDRAFSILELLNSSKRGWNISEMGRKLEIPKSTTHVLVSTLERLGYIRQHPPSRRFHLSTKLFALGRRALNLSPLPDAALPHLRWLVQETGFTAHVGILERSQVVFVQKVDGPGIIKFDTYIGKTSALHCTGLGKSLVAFQPEDSIENLLASYSYNRFTRKTISSREMFMVELARVRRLGYSMDDEEEELGIRCVAAPILSVGNVSAAVSVTGTVSQIQIEDMDKVVALTRHAAARISASI